MKIAFIGSICKPTQLHTKGGQEVWSSIFLLEAIKSGHVFDLYAIKGSLDIPDHINLIPLMEKGKDEIKNDPFFSDKKGQKANLDAITYAQYSKCISLMAKKQYDLIIDSSGNPLPSLSGDLFELTPIIVVGHFPVEKPYVNLFQYLKLPTNIHYVFVSKYQYDKARWIPENQKSFIYNSISLDAIDFQNGDVETKNNIVWVGRIDPDMSKGCKEVIQTVLPMKKPLDIYAYVEKDAEDYMKKEILPLVSQDTFVNIHSQNNFVSINDRFKKAKTFLFPIQWEEPFGLVMIEAMATGTPVVAYARGAVPEIIQDGVTGFVVNPSDSDIRGNWIIKKTGIDGLREAVERIYGMSPEEYKHMRQNCRTHVEKNFTVQRMIEQYESLYKEILAKK